MRRAAFTLVELILVMAILTIVMAFVAPVLSGSLRGRALEQEATRLVALTEFASDEAVSQGVPMSVWIDTKSGRFGLQPASDYAAPDVHREYTLGEEVHFDGIDGAVEKDGTAIEFTADGVPGAAGVESVRLADQRGAMVTVVRRSDGSGYEVAKEDRR